MTGFPPRGHPDRDSFMEGYRTGEMERIALAEANSLLRSRLRELEQQSADHKTDDTPGRYSGTL